MQFNSGVQLMRLTKSLSAAVAVAILISLCGYAALAQSGSRASRTIEVTAEKAEFEVGEHAKFAAVAKDSTGKLIDQKPAWYATPFDLAAVDANGTVTFYQPGEVTVFALFGSRPGFLKV